MNPETQNQFDQLYAMAGQAQANGNEIDTVLYLDAAIDLLPTHDSERILALSRLRYASAWKAFKWMQDHAEWRHYDRVQRILSTGATHSGWFVGETTLATPAFSNATLLELTRAHAAMVMSQYAEIANRINASKRLKKTGDKIKLGFVGADFFQQATAYLLTAMIAHIDRDRFEVIAYDHHAHTIDDEYRQKSLAAYDCIKPIAELNDIEAADLIHADGIDVLFCIKNPAQSRLGIFIQRPAPIQVHYLYFPGTSGMPFFDYIVADDVVIPNDLESGYAEKVARIKGCYQPNDPERPLAKMSTRADWGLPDDAIIMSNMSQVYKITPHMFDLWCQLLRQDSRRILWLLSCNKTAQSNLQREALLRSIDPSHLYFAHPSDSQTHFTRLALSDVVLDTYPYGGHTLTSDALWAGTPVVTLQGSTFASRVASSLLTSVNLPTLIATTDDGYMNTVNRLLTHPSLKKDIKTHLNTHRNQFDLFNAVSYAQRFEKMLESL